MNCLLLPATSFASNTATIESAAHLEHVHHILKATEGDTLKIGQLNGHIGTAIIDKMTPTHIRLCEVRLTLMPPPKLNLTVVLALPRPKVLRRLVIDMTALGVRNIVLINSFRTQKSYWQSPMLARLDAFILEGLQQGVDTIPPLIELQQRFKPFVQDELATIISGHAIVAHPYAALSFSQYLQQLQTSLPAFASTTDILPGVVCIGAEGGWIDYEIELLKTQGCQAVSMGPRILRTEAAVNALLGQWLLNA